ncbi:L-seryl-tRNA(Sec) kinase,putative [Plasmodium sp. gorilla clade G2]|uniref:L-seryl-tRNA(Sec) kinase,putative n=1 Tax=Plasmodium sp. gorilla clade G2 TaxID=880535 RepID=UPI000D295428|nr:L-seryl-tRNA(Sec) kinase,putative [Plasmodium sp. gorilla clade G2]SOV20142.1 L-seryl-tRNA(Sec) kinase,putative [Plasmodium sp. gorilla clade G2]
MNFVLLFYGPPCSGKDKFINYLLKRNKVIYLFLYFFVNIKNEKECSYKQNVEEKKIFIKIIKYYYQIKEREQKNILRTIRRKEDNIAPSFSFLIFLTRHFLNIINKKSSIFILNKYRNTQNETFDHLEGKKKHHKNSRKKIKRKNNNKINNNHKYNKIYKKFFYKPCIHKYNKKLFFIFYKNIYKFIKYFKKFLTYNFNTYIYNISTDQIEKLFYDNTNYIIDAFKRQQIERIDTNNCHVCTLNKSKFYIFHKKDKKINGNIFYPVFKKSNIINKNDTLFIKLKKTNKKEKKKQNKKPTSYNQIKYWNLSREIAYEYCKNIMRRGGTQNRIIILNDTFHLPSMRKEYYILTKKYPYNYIQTYINTPLATCLNRNKKRVKFKYISSKTIIRNYKCHKKYSIQSNQEKYLSKMIHVVKSKFKWQEKILSLQVNTFYKKYKTKKNKVGKFQLVHILRFIYNHFDNFKNMDTIKIRKHDKKKNDMNPNKLNILNVTINKIIHEKLKNLPNEKKNEYAKRFHVIKLEILKECRMNKMITPEYIDKKLDIS